MAATTFYDTNGEAVAARISGKADAPAVLLLGTRDWSEIARALELAGRRVIELANGDESGLRAVLAQLGARPVIVSDRTAAPIAAETLAGEGGNLAAGLVLIGAHETRLTLPVTTIAEAESGDALSALLLDFLERHAPVSPPEYRAGSDARTLRDALGCFATGVTIVTAIDAEGQPIGLTANSFTSVSLDPPLLLVCIARASASAATLETAAYFAVNVLQIGQQPASNRFAGKTEDRFAATDWAAGETGAPVLAGSLSAFECARHAVHDGGDHFILIGRVIRAIFEPRRDPLLYFRGKYRRLHFA